jgi:hypothetical protein
MALSTWPDVPSQPQVDGFQQTPWSAPAIVTEMNGGNSRSRRRPGDNVTALLQRIRMTDSQLATFESWFSETLGGGAGRFTMDVWTGAAYENKVCQFNLSQPVQYAYVADDITDVVMQLKVFNV